MKKFYYAEYCEAGAPRISGPFDTLEEAKQAYDLPAAALWAYEDEGWNIEGAGAMFFSINLENGVREEEEEYFFTSRYDEDDVADWNDQIGFVPPEDGEE